MKSLSGERESQTVGACLPPLPSEGGPTFICKPCSSCGGMCGERDFRADPRASDGLRSQCMRCEHAAERVRYWRRKAANPAAVSARNIEAGRRYRARLAVGE